VLSGSCGKNLVYFGTLLSCPYLYGRTPSFHAVVLHRALSSSKPFSIPCKVKRPVERCTRPAVVFNGFGPGSAYC
jgi:hypothetical protein